MLTVTIHLLGSAQYSELDFFASFKELAPGNNFRRRDERKWLCNRAQRRSGRRKPFVQLERPYSARGTRTVVCLAEVEMFSFGLRGISRAFSTTAVAEFPKLKTHQGAKKRWKAISSGAFKRARAGHSHLNVGKRPDRKNRLSQLAYSSSTQTSILKKAMPYS